MRWLWLTILLVGCSPPPPPPAPPIAKKPGAVKPTRAPLPATRTLSPLDKVRRHALAAPKAVEKDVKSVAAYLVKGCRDDHEKAFAIYCWITDRIDYDGQALKTKNHPDPRAPVTLRRRKAVCLGYAELYRQLAKHSGLSVEGILGYVKSEDPLELDQDPEIYHAWNAVYFANDWHLLDSTWGAGALDRKFQFHARYKPEYFDVAPERMLASHFPFDPRWQLRRRPPMTQCQFNLQCHLRPDFFAYGLELMDNREQSITFDRETSIRLRIPEKIYVRAFLSQNDDEVQGQYVLVSRRGDVRAFEVRTPKPGAYTLKIWAGTVWQGAPVVSYHRNFPPRK